MAKAATHFLAKSLAEEGSGLPSGTRVVCALPKVLDTPSNRKWMGGPGVDFGTWTPLDELAGRYVRWCEGKEEEEDVPSGALVLVETQGGKTSYKVVG